MPGYILILSEAVIDLSRRRGGVLSFTLKDGSRDDAWSFLNATRLMSLTANLGDVKTTVCHPAMSTHGRLDQVDRQLMGIPENMIQLLLGSSLLMI